MLAGTFDRHPNLRVVFGQLGGVLPLVLGRFDLIHRLISRADTGGSVSRSTVPVLRRLRDHTGQVYVDTHSMDAPALECALDVLGPDHIVFGSDFPVTPADAGREDALRLLRRTAGDHAAAVLAGNALSLLRPTIREAAA